MKKNHKKVLVALSGGVDSSVAAALIKKQGFDVVGIFLKFWQPELPNCQNSNTCCNFEALHSARSVCQKLKIPFYVDDVRKKFKREVVDYYLKSFFEGITPNPCVVCNKTIKFGYLIERAKKIGCDFIATGHYARIERKFLNKSQIKDSQTQIKLLKAKDRKKDQSYFLWQLNKNELKHILFPIGNYTKTAVRSLAKKFGLPTYAKPESQDICFVPQGKREEFLQKYAPKLFFSGNVLDTNGKKVGTHNGLANYTIGQREKLPVIDYKKMSIIINQHRRQPLYVIKLNAGENELVIGEKKDLYHSRLIAENSNFINLLKYDNLKFTAKIRYGHKPETCKLEVNNKKIKVFFHKPVRAITPGQSIVFYQGAELIGGGIIKEYE